MTLLSTAYPPLIHAHRHADNGLFPETSFYERTVAANNHVVAYRRKPLYRRTWPLGLVAPSPSTIARWHCRTGYGAKRAVVLLNLGFDQLGTAANPYVEIALTKSGGATTTLTFHGGATDTAGDDAPNWFFPQIQHVDVDAASIYTGTVTTYDGARVISLAVFEEHVATVDEGTYPFSEWEPSAGSPIYDNRQATLLAGAGDMLRYNRGLRFDWSLDAGTARTRTSATLVNLHDNSSTGSPTASTPGVSFDTRYRNTVSRTTIPCVLAVYGSMSSGSGEVRIVDTTGATHATTTINSSTPGWFLSSGAALPASASLKVDPMFGSDGSNTLTVYAVSLYEDG